MDYYIVGIRQKDEDEQIYSLLLSQTELGNLLLNIDDDKFEVGEVVKTFSEKADSILQFCKKDDKLETGIEEKENTDDK